MKRQLYTASLLTVPPSASRFPAKISLSKMMIAVLILFCSQKTSAQCTTFHNADSANPILNASPVPQNIYNLKFVDIDADGDLDCYLYDAGSTGLVLYRNVGDKHHPKFVLCPNNGFENTTLTPFSYTFAFADLDGDGDQDFITYNAVAINNSQTGRGITSIQYYENIGTPQNPDFTQSSGPISYGSTSPAFYFIDLSFQDVNGDGSPDFFVATADFGELDKEYQLNTGTVSAPSFGNFTPVTVVQNTGYATFYDFTGDGLPDLIQNDGVSTSYFQPNQGTISNPQFANFPYFGSQPNFGGIAPSVLVDLNGDGAVEEFNRSGHYGTLAPVAVIKMTQQKIGNRMFTKLSASQTAPGYKYEWEYNGKLIPGYNKPFIYPLKKGEYVLYITDACGTGVSLPYHTSDVATDKTDNNLVAAATLPGLATTVKAYPNPFTQSFLLQLPANRSASKSTIRITDMAGRIWLTQTTSAASLTIGAMLPKGTYRLQVWQNNQVVFRTTVLKQ